MTQLTAAHALITGNADDYVAETKRAELAGSRLGRAMGTLKGKMSALGASMRPMAGASRQLSFQLSQVGQSAMVTGNLVQALAVQLPDIGLAFGAVGAAAGLVAGIALPALMAAFSSTGDRASELGDAMKDLETKTRDAEDAFRVLQLGLRNAEELRVIDEIARLTSALQRLEDQARRAPGPGLDNGANARERAAALRAEIAALEQVLDKHRKAEDSLKRLQREYANKKSAVELAVERVKDLAENTSNLLTITQRVATAAWDYAGALGTARKKAVGGMDRAVQETREEFLPNGLRRSDVEVIKFPGRGGNGGAGGGGGFGGETTADRLARVQEELASEADLEMQAFAERQAILEAALQQKLLTQEEYNQLMQESQRQHMDAMVRIDAMKYGGILAQTESFMGGLANVLAVGGAKAFAISKKFAAAEAFVSALRGAAKALELPFPANMLAYAKVLATGRGLVSAINGASVGGTNTGAGATAGAGAAQPQVVQNVQDVNVNLPQGAQYDLVQVILESIGDRLGDGANIRNLRVSR